MTWTIQDSRYSDILDAIYTIGTTGPITFPRSKKGEIPTPEEMGTPGNPGEVVFPWFAVRQGVFAGYATGTDLNTGQPGAGMRGMGIIEPVWDFDIYMLWRYTPANPNATPPLLAPITHYAEAATAMTTMSRLFSENLQLNGTCAVSTVHSPGIQYIEMKTVPMTVARFTVQAYEILTSDYS